MTTSLQATEVQAPPPISLRLVRGKDAWWAIHGTKVARLSLSAVDLDDTGQPTLVPEALTALCQQGILSPTPATAYSVTVLTATSCNLGCAYCFQNTALPADGSFAPPRIPTLLLDADTIKRIVGFVGGQMNRYGLTETNLLLFGGEPLLNPQGAIGMLRALAPLRLRDTEIITNGVPLTRSRALALAEAGLKRVQITFDGHRDSHDNIRVTRNGRGTYDTILRNVTAAAAATDLHWHFRINVSHRTVHRLEALIDDLAQTASPHRISLHLALIDDIGLGYDNTIGYTSDYRDQIIVLHDRAINHGIYVAPSQPLSSCPYCSAFGGTRGAVINADGKLYSCWETAGRDEQWIVGDVTDGYLPDETIRSRWVACDFDIKPHGNDQQTREFFDRIDAAALDSIYAYRQRLRRGSPD